MAYDPRRHRRRSIRLPGYDYAAPGAYFVTICVQHYRCLLGQILEETVARSAAGQIVQQTWEALPQHYPTVELDAFVVMPNHVHGIVLILSGDASNGRSGGVMNHAPTSAGLHGHGLMNTPEVSLGKIIRAFKARATRMIRVQGIDFAWQRNYWERVLRGERERQLARRYILENPLRWHLDRLHPERRPW